VHEHAAQLCITAGAGMDLIDRWSRESRRHNATWTKSGAIAASGGRSEVLS
jgi:hypothetical protein